MVYGLLGAAFMLLWLFCIIDVIMTPDAECRHLPKLLWLGIVVLLGAIGSVAWLLVGRPWAGGSPLERLVGGGREGADERRTPGSGGHDRPGRVVATSPDDDDEFLARLREHTEAQRRTEAARRREQEQAETAEREQRRGDGEPEADRDDRS